MDVCCSTGVRVQIECNEALAVRTQQCPGKVEYGTRLLLLQLPLAAQLIVTSTARAAVTECVPLNVMTHVVQSTTIIGSSYKRYFRMPYRTLL